MSGRNFRTASFKGRSLWPLWVCIVIVVVMIPLWPLFYIIGIEVFQTCRMHYEESRLRERELTGSPFEEGTKIAQALERYRAEKGYYPGSLEELTPDFIASIPNPNWGYSGWLYRKFESPETKSERYSLQVNFHAESGFLFDSGKKWTFVW